MRISDWSSDVCSSDLPAVAQARQPEKQSGDPGDPFACRAAHCAVRARTGMDPRVVIGEINLAGVFFSPLLFCMAVAFVLRILLSRLLETVGFYRARSEEHTSELQSLMRISYAFFCLKKKPT